MSASLMTLNCGKLYIDGIEAFIEGLKLESLSPPAFIEPMIEPVHGSLSVKISPDYIAWWQELQDDSDDADYAARRPCALQRIGEQILALRDKCNFSIIRERANLYQLWRHGGHYYRNVSDFVLASEFSGRRST